MAADQELRRKAGIGDAVIMGLGSIVGTGVFVSIGIGFDVAGPMVLPAILVATLVATLNGLSSAQLAANHPVSGGTYAYGYRWLSPVWGFSAGTLFIVAKSASAATAALGCALYTLEWLGAESFAIRTGMAFGLVVLMTLLVSGGLKRSNRMNWLMVMFTIGSLVVFVVCGLGTTLGTTDWSMAAGGNAGEQNIQNGSALGASFWQCCALMFVAFTGYGRIATLGEEIVEPQRNIPRAIILTLVISGLLYAAVGLVYVLASAGARDGDSTEILTLKSIAGRLDVPLIHGLISIAAITAMLGVLLNLILGLSRVWFAMGRNGDLPSWLGKLNTEQDSPVAAVLVTGVVVAALTLVGDVKLTWSFSAMTVLLYYAVTNLAATRLTAEERMFPVELAWLGFLGCLSLAFFVEIRVLLTGAGVLLAAMLLRLIWRRSIWRRSIWRRSIK